MSRLKVFLTHAPDMLANYYGPRAVAALRDMAEVIVNPTGRSMEEADLIAHAQGCAIVVSDRLTPGYAGFFRNAPDLVAFLRCAVDIRNVDVEAASAEGILATRATPGFIASVAELGFGMMIDLARHVSASVGVYRAGGDPPPRMGVQLKGSTIGILGYGAIGARMAELALAFGMTVIAADPHKTITTPGVRQASSETVLAEADFVVCLVVATEATEKSHGCRGLRADEALRLLHQPVARQSRRRGGLASRARRQAHRRGPPWMSAARRTRSRRRASRRGPTWSRPPTLVG